jgi:HSP20 family protein
LLLLQGAVGISGSLSRHPAVNVLAKRGYTMRRRSGYTYALPVDVYSTENELVIEASVPGLEPGDVEITIEGETLTIKGERRAPLENVDYHIQERRYGFFARTLTLNLPVESEDAEAVFEKGVLTLTIPKAEEARPRMIKVKSK